MTVQTSSGFGVSPRSLELLEHAEHPFRCFIGEPVATASAALEDSPDMVTGHVPLAFLMLSGTEPAGLPFAMAACCRAQGLPANEREARHVRAACLLVGGRRRAAARVLEDLTIDHPLDTLVLQAGHQTDFLHGDSRMLRDRIARALPAWHTDMPAWHAVAGMLAFGLDIDAGLALHDGPVCGDAPGALLDLVDPSALPWRPHLRGINAGTRWQALADCRSPNAATGCYALNDMPATMAFAAAGRTERIRAIADAQQAVIAGMGESDADNARFTHEVGHAATAAMAAFAEGDYARTADRLRLIRHIAHGFGGSHAPRNVIDLTLIEAAARGGQPSLVNALRAERALQVGS